MRFLQNWSPWVLRRRLAAAQAAHDACCVALAVEKQLREEDNRPWRAADANTCGQLEYTWNRCKRIEADLSGITKNTRYGLICDAYSSKGIVDQYVTFAAIMPEQRIAYNARARELAKAYPEHFARDLVDAMYEQLRRQMTPVVEKVLRELR